ncbi:hypothetical protein Q8A67_000345 [Cirrhinus molitorella]|uniref:Uncharacterized protein n=1 Tax=Cirrhinus molitorella TaxID=172907 RepID=A0AA88U6M6_9TELE|nr:hypothetical protein Q8A67_000345 [Cirrhinus molitorella]
MKYFIVMASVHFHKTSVSHLQQERNKSLKQHEAAEIKKDQVLKASVEVWRARGRNGELHLISVIKLAVSAAALSDGAQLHVCALHGR